LTLSLDPDAYRDLVRHALAEDIGTGDITTDAVVEPGRKARGVFVAKSPLTLAGLDVALEALRQRDAAIQIERMRADGDACAVGDIIAVATGDARALLTAERVALNFLQRLSGIATLTRRFVDAAGGRITVLDTRKTTPTLRRLEKYAVTAGGGTNHRGGLDAAILIKDNHVRLAGGIAKAIARARQHQPGPIEVEAQSLAEVDQAIAAGADVILADNLDDQDIRETVRRVRGRARVEISGGVTLDRLPALAATGADYVSIGALTHSAPAADISFEIDAA
jgi:nicotinate-nucleotide pyrophosphorylase (carboxylating)